MLPHDIAHAERDRHHRLQPYRLSPKAQAIYRAGLNSRPLSTGWVITQLKVSLTQPRIVLHVRRTGRFGCFVLPATPANDALEPQVRGRRRTKMQGEIMVGRSIRIGSWLSAALLFGVLGARSASALEADELSPTDIQSKHLHFVVKAPFSKVIVGKPADGGSGSAAFGGGIPGIDSLTNFTGQFSSPGLDPSGNPASTWYYSMVGNSPELGGTTTIGAPIIPVTVELLDQNGHVRHSHGARLVSNPHHLVDPVLQSPVFSSTDFSSSRSPTQYTDAVQRAEFFSLLDDEEDHPWHTLLGPSVKTGRTIQIPYGKYQFALKTDGTCCAYMYIDETTFGNLLFPPTYPVDNTTVMGAAELSGDATTKTITTLLFSDIYLYENGDPTQCCILGYHTFDFEPGATATALPRAYITIYASWISPGLFRDNIEDVTALSHEMAETFNDPFVAFDGVHNVTPWWLSSGPTSSQCQDVMEVGDVVEVLSNPVVAITLDGFTYHPQTVALLEWFEFKRHSHAIDGAYSYPDTTVLTALSPPETVNCK
jgi:hypothetical protein